MNHLQLLYIRVQQLKANFGKAKISLPYGTTALLGSSGRIVSIFPRGCKKNGLMRFTLRCPFYLFRKCGILTPMGTSIVFVNQKGGVGKTTSAVNIGAYFSQAGKKTLLVDFDPQGNMSSGVGISKKQPSIYDAIAGKIPIQKTVRTTAVKDLYAIPADINLSGATIELVDQQSREFFLRDNLALLKEEYEYILIDCPPSLGILTLNGLAAADEVFIPLQCEYFALEGLTLLLQTVKRVQEKINPRLKIGGIFFTMYDSRTKLAQEVVQQVTAYFKDRVCSTIIPRNVRLSEAPSHGLPICKYDASCIGARSYEKLAQEVLNRA